MAEYEYLVNCDDGGDPNCWGKLKIFLHVADLSDEQLEEILDKNQTCITKRQLEKSDIKIDAEDKKILDEYGCIKMDFYPDSTCAPCGSGETYDSDGNNTTAL